MSTEAPFVINGPLDPALEDEIRLKLIYILAPICMTTSTATVPETINTHADQRATRLMAWVEAIMRKL